MSKENWQATAIVLAIVLGFTLLGSFAQSRRMRDYCNALDEANSTIGNTHGQIEDTQSWPRLLTTMSYKA